MTPRLGHEAQAREADEHDREQLHHVVDERERERGGHIQALIDQMLRRALSPHAAAVRLLNELSIGEEA